MSDMMKVAIVGDAALLVGFRALGIKVFSPANPDEARAVLALLEKEDITASASSTRGSSGPSRRRGRRSVGNSAPSSWAFRTTRTASDHLEVMLREMAVRATGSDALVKRKG